MSSFKFFWTVHKWTGLIAAAFFACTATTGFLLLIKKKVDWIQPPTPVWEVATQVIATEEGMDLQ